MKYKLSICILLMTAVSGAAQVASHAPSAIGAAPAAPAAMPAANPMSLSPLAQISDKPVVRVNGAVLTDRDLLREMYAIFPYAKQHNGFPKAQEASIRQGALEMIIFEELVYQEAERRKLTVSAAKLNQAEAEFRKQFHSPDEYDQYMQAEMHGSRQVLRQQITRSLLIEEILKAEVDDKSAVTLAEVRAYYDKNPKRFQTGESFNIQSISFMPPQKPTPEIIEKNRKRAEDALRQAKATTSYEGFGLLAEKISEDDFRVNMGDHKAVGADKLPPTDCESGADHAGRPGKRSHPNRERLHHLPPECPQSRQKTAVCRSESRPAHRVGQEQVRTAALESGETTPG